MLPAEPGGQLATTIAYDGDIRLMIPGATYPGECVGYLEDPDGSEATAATVASCPSTTLTARTHYNRWIGDGGVYRGNLVVLPHAPGMSAGNSYLLNVTFAQDVDWSQCSLDVAGATTTADVKEGLRANNILIQVNLEESDPLVFIIHYTSPFPEEQLCLYDIDCSYTTEEDFRDGLSINAASNPLSLVTTHGYDALVEYECGKGRGFDIINWPSQLPQVLSLRCTDQFKWIYEDPDSDIKGDDFDTATMPTCQCKIRSKWSVRVPTRINYLPMLQGPTALSPPFLMQQRTCTLTQQWTPMRSLPLAPPLTTSAMLECSLRMMRPSSERR